MLRVVKRGVRKAFQLIGYDIVPREDQIYEEWFPRDFDESMIELFRYVKPFTMTSKERVFALHESVKYIVEHNIPGDIVECGVWKGGSMMAVARTLMENRSTDRKLYLFDTFEGMTEPTEFDRNYKGEVASDFLEILNREGLKWAYCPLEEVKRSMRLTGYNESNVCYVKGRVEETIPAFAPERIALLRLDTDWYESTYHELVHLYPRLSVGGVLIVDDYGHWEGARRAVDQFMKEQNLKLLLHRIDYSGRMCVKLEA